MLLVGKVGAGGEGYYLATTPWYGTGIEESGRWLGLGSERLGLYGTVEAEQLSQLLSGRHPVDGDELSTGGSRARIAAFDLTFCAPKSVSVLHGLSQESVASEVALSHRSAVVATLGYIESRALTVRRTVDGGRVPLPAQGAMAAAFSHRTSRELDPHLHTHVLLVNQARDRIGRWSAVDGRGLYAHRAAADALYHSHLRYELTSRLGVEWGVPRNGRADLVGIGQEARAEFSRRSQAIAEELSRVAVGRSGRSHMDRSGFTQAELRSASVRTRPDKEVHVSADDLRERWRRRASEVGLGPQRLDAVLERGPQARRGMDGADRSSVQLDPEPVQLGVGCSGRPSVHRRDVVLALSAESRPGLTVDAVELLADGIVRAWSPDDERRSRSLGRGVAEESLDPGRPADMRGLDQERPRPRLLERSVLELGRRFEPDLGFGR